jgi:hypothetical protein
MNNISTGIDIIEIDRMEKDFLKRYTLNKKLITATIVLPTLPVDSQQKKQQ